jgi:hypothetical protein
MNRSFHSEKLIQIFRNRVKRGAKAPRFAV